MLTWRTGWVYALAVLALALGIATSKNSTMAAWMSGRCFAKSPPPICVTRGRFSGAR
jgi:hypothetical protein